MTESSGQKSEALLQSGHRVTRGRVLLGFSYSLGVCALLLTAWFVYSVRATDRVMPGVLLEGMIVSGVSRTELIGRLDTFARERAHRPLLIRLGGVRLQAEPEQLGFGVNADASARLALEAGRKGPLPARFAQFVVGVLKPRRVPVQLRIEPERLGAALDRWEAEAIEDAPFDGGISLAGTTVSPLYPHGGRRLDRSRARTQLEDAYRTGKDAEPLATRTETPKVRAAEVDRVVDEARHMLGGEVLLSSVAPARSWLLTSTQLGSVLRVVPDQAANTLALTCAPEAVHELLAARRGELEQSPENARFVIDAKDGVRVEPGHAGLTLADAAVARALCIAARSPERKADLPFDSGAEPALTTAAAEAAGISGLMGSYTTRHACCQPRVQNIHHIADLLDGTLVRPGETFSVNQFIGPRTVKNGFRPAPSIEDGDMVDTVGGGVSQFATTLFNALFYGGYDILERQPHSYWFTRYPMGYDATLSYPHPDIVFKNDTEACALIKTSYTDTSITVKVYGNNGGRRVSADVSERQNIVPPPLEYIPNPRLDADKEKTREGGMIGWTVTVTRTLTFADGKLKKERRKVTYKPRARRVEVHPCRIPQGAPGHTGERCPLPEPDALLPGDTGAK